MSAYFQLEIEKLKKIVQSTWNTNLASWTGLMAPLSHHEWKVTSRWRDGYRSHHLYTHWLTPQIVRFKYLHMMRVFLGLEKCNYDRCICLFSSSSFFANKNDRGLTLLLCWICGLCTYWEVHWIIRSILLSLYKCWGIMLFPCFLWHGLV